MDAELDSLLEALEAPPTGGDSLEGARLHRAVRARLLDEAVPETRIHRYVVLERLGVGGMGVVYAAHDPELDRRVAIKLVRHWGSDDREADQQRLVREARTLAKLSHPNVVALYDVGMFGDRVFLVMEHVRGVSLRSHVRDHARPWQELLACFVQAGEGLAAAHEIGIVHRDFKPDNALVGDDGRVRVLDFGLAHGEGPPPPVTSTSGVDFAIGTLTATGKVVGTPAYMAPEQFAGAPADARTDQFSFCVALWEALFDRRPFHATTITQLRLLFDQGVIMAPADPQRAPPWLRRVLERGLAMDPARRWPSMRALLDACASPPRRRRWWWLGLGIAGGAVALGFGGLAWQRARQRAACERDATELGAAWTADTASLVAAAFGSTEPTHARDTAARVDRVLTEDGTAWTAAFANSCIAAHEGVITDAAWQLRRGCYDEHRARIEAFAEVLQAPDRDVVNAALRIAHQLPPPSRCEDDGRLARLAGQLGPAADLEALAGTRRRIARAQLLADASRPEALAAAEAARDEAQGLGDPIAIAEAEFAIASAYRARGEHADAAEAYQRAYFLAEPIGADEIALLAATQLVDTTGYQLSHVDEGLGWARHAEALLERSGNAPMQAAELAHRLATVLEAKGDTAAARASYERAIALRTELAGPDHPSLGRDWANLGKLLSDHRDADQAAAAFDEAERIFLAAYGPVSTQLAAVYAGRTRVAQIRGDQAAVVKNCELSLAMEETLSPPGHPRIAAALGRLALARTESGAFDEARALFHRAIAMQRGQSGPSNLRLATSLANLAVLEQHAGNLATARGHLEEALALRRALLPPQHVDIAIVLASLGDVMLRQREFEAALGYYDEVRAMSPGDDLRTRHERTRALVGIGSAQLELGHPELAREPLEAALADPEAEDSDPIARCELRLGLARALVEGGRDGARAQALAREAEALCREDEARGREYLEQLVALNRPR